MVTSTEQKEETRKRMEELRERTRAGEVRFKMKSVSLRISSVIEDDLPPLTDQEFQRLMELVDTIRKVKAPPKSTTPPS